MAISSEYVPVKVSGDGVTAEFSFPFRIFQTSDLTVLILDKTTDEVLFTRVLGTHYTVEINRVTEGGAITFGGSFIPTSDQNVFIASVIPNTQPTSYILGGKLAEKSFEAMGDRLLRLIQQVLRKVDRSIKLPETDLGEAPTLPPAESGKAIGWDSLGGLTNMTLDPGTALPKASQAEAEAGANNTGYMTALRTKQNIDARLASQAEAEAGVENTKVMTPLRVAQAITELVPEPPFITGLYKNIKVIRPSTTTVTVTADRIILDNGERVDSLNATADMSTAGPALNGRDHAGAFSSNSWVYIWVISNGETPGLILSASASAPAGLPSGYAAKALISAARIDGSGNFIDFIQDGAEYVYKTWRTMASGNTGGSWAAIDTAAFVPSALSNFIHTSFEGNGASGAVVLVSDKNTQSTVSSNTNQPNRIWGSGDSSLNGAAMKHSWLLTTANTLYWKEGAGTSYAFCVGFKINKL